MLWRDGLCPVPNFPDNGELNGDDTEVVPPSYPLLQPPFIKFDQVEVSLDILPSIPPCFF